MKVKVHTNWDHSWDCSISVKKILPRVAGISAEIVTAVQQGLSVGRCDWYSDFGYSYVQWDLNPLNTSKHPWIEAVSTSGNKCRITDHPYQGVLVKFTGRRHAMRDWGNEAGDLFSLIFGGRWENGVEIPLNDELLKRAHVLLYESTRKDAPWWECGLG